MPRPLACVALLLLAPAPARAQAAPAVAPAAPVDLDGQVALTLRAGVASFTAADRARLIQERLDRLAEDPGFDVHTLRLGPGELSTDIVTGDQVLASVTEADARAAGRSREALAGEGVIVFPYLPGAQSSAFQNISLFVGVLVSLDRAPRWPTPWPG